MVPKVFKPLKFYCVLVPQIICYIYENIHSSENKSIHRQETKFCPLAISESLFVLGIEPKLFSTESAEMYKVISLYCLGMPVAIFSKLFAAFNIINHSLA